MTQTEASRAKLDMASWNKKKVSRGSAKLFFRKSSNWKAAPKPQVNREVKIAKTTCKAAPAETAILKARL